MPWRKLHFGENPFVLLIDSFLVLEFSSNFFQGFWSTQIFFFSLLMMKKKIPVQLMQSIYLKKNTKVNGCQRKKFLNHHTQIIGSSRLPKIQQDYNLKCFFTFLSYLQPNLANSYGGLCPVWPHHKNHGDKLQTN